MENVAVSRRNISKNGNKENAQPAFGNQTSIKRDRTTAPPFQLKNNKKEETLGQNGPLKAKANQADIRSTSGEALKKAKTVQRNVKAALPVAGIKQHQTHSQAFLSEQATRHKKIVSEAPKPTVAAPSSKPAPGMYKGKIIQSKIGSIWKSGASVGRAVPETSAPKTGRDASRRRSKSVTELQGRGGTQRPAPTRSKSVSDGPAARVKPAVVSGRPAGGWSARPPVRTQSTTLPSTSTSTRNPTLPSTSTRNTRVAPAKGSVTLNSKPKIPVTDKKVTKPAVSSTLSQYRFSKETTEERRAKLASWQAAKGKSFKRPAMTAAAHSKAKAVAKPGADLKAQPKPRPAAPSNPEPEPQPSLETHRPNTAAPCADTQREEVTTTHSHTEIMNTTLDLLEDSDAGLPAYPQDGVEDIVVNLCDALEAMETPSRCNNEISEVTDVRNNVEMDDGQEEEEREELKSEVSEQPEVEQVKDEVEESDDEDVTEQPEVEQVKDEVEESETDDEDLTEQPEVERVKDEVEESDDDDEDVTEQPEVERVKDEVEESESEDDDDVTETTPKMEGASVVKYSVKTTPYLQSVKRTIEGEASASTSRRKSNIKDLKFLTPVRRSCRIQRNTPCLPPMLVDHDPCVSSLAELVTLDQDPNAYIYRKNPALLLQDLPDQH